MGGKPAVTQPTAQHILDSARQLASLVPQLSSLALEPVFENASCQLIEPWRKNGALVEHPLHSMMCRVGGFPPALARYLVAAYSQPGDCVFDPYCGKGTALLEASRLSRHAIGGDVAPDAVTVARAKCIP